MASKIREKQIQAIRRMLNLNAPVAQSSNVAALEPVWKVLVYDRAGQDIVFPLLGVKELRDLGVTLHLLLHSDREPIPDVPALYFVLPTEENVQRICQDLQNGVYESYYFNFISPISRQRLEDIAAAALAGNCVTQVNKVFDQYLSFISLEEDLFMLKHQRNVAFSYYGVNRGDIKDEEVEAIMDSIVDGLFCVFATLGAVPVIRCPRGNAAEMVAEKLDKKLRENVRDPRNSLFSADGFQGQLTFNRPLLVILDRNVDLATMLHHTWTYQALIHDVLDLDLNRVHVNPHKSVMPESAMSKKPGKTYDLEPTDNFWSQKKGCPFPEVAEAVQEELDQYRASEDKVKQLKTAMGLNGDAESDEAISMISDNTAKLTSAVSSLPELLERKRLIDLHMTVATSVLDEIKARKLDVYFEVEEKVMSKSQLDRSLLDMITDSDFGTPEDKMRLFLIHYICSNPVMSQSEVDQYAAALRNAGCDLSPLTYMKRWKAYANLGSMTSANQYGGGGTKTVNMFSKLMTQGSSFVMEGVKNLVVKKHNLPVTRIVEALMEHKSSSEVEDYRFFDPKLLRGAGSGGDHAQAGTGARSRIQYSDAIVFTIGGGNYIEYQNLMDYAKSRPGTGVQPQKQIIYGSTNLQNASHFLKQLGSLGEDIGN